MFRVALIAYLSLTTVLGPALCCCNAQQLFSVVNGSSCCGKLVAQHSDAKTAQHAAHDHHDGHAHHRHESSPAKDTSKSEQAPVSHDHDGQNCPCGRHHASLVAAVADSVQSKAVEMQNQTWSVLVAILTVVPEFDVREASINAQLRPADLYGREILRAYQILRC